MDKLSERLDDLEARVAALEELCAQMNEEITSMQTVISALEEGLYITDVREVGDGYLIEFSNGDTITIRHGEDGTVLLLLSGSHRMMTASTTGPLTETGFWMRTAIRFRLRAGTVLTEKTVRTVLTERTETRSSAVWWSETSMSHLHWLTALRSRFRWRSLWILFSMLRTWRRQS